MARRRTVYGNEESQTLSRLTLSDGFNMIRGDALIRTKQNSASPDQGALVVTGGVGIGMTLNVGGGLSVKCSDGQSVSIGNSDTISGLNLFSHLQTDVVPYDDSIESLGNSAHRWDSVWVDNIVNPGPIQIHSTSTDPNVGVLITDLQLQGNFTIAGPAHFMSSMLVDGPTHLNETSVDTTQGNFSVIGPGNFNVEAPSFNVHCNELTLNCTDTVKGVSIATQNDGVPFFFGNQNSTCTFNGKFVLVRGDLQVMGNTTTINSQIVDIEDHQIELGVIADPNDTTADGGGIVLKGSTDKSLLWHEATGLWTFNTGVDIQAGNSLHADAISGKSVGLTLSDGMTNVLTLLNGRVGVNATAPRVTVDIQDTDAIHIPVGSTVQRPNSAIVQTGMVRYNTDLHRYEGFTQAGAWASLGGVVDQAQTTYISVESDDNTTDVHRIRFFVQGVEVSDFDPTGKLGLGTTNPAVRLDIQDTDAIHIPVGSTVQRPNSAIVETGMMRYNTDLHRYEGYTQAGAWASLGGVVDQEQTTYITVESDDNTTDVHRIRFFVQGVEVSDFDPTGKLGLGTTNPAVRLDIQDTDAIHIPVGSTAQRPSSAIVETGMMRYNTDLHRYEGYTQADVWGSLGGVIDQAQTTYITVESDDNTTDTHSIRFFTNGVQVAILDPSGRLGIDTLAPRVTVDIQGTDAVHIPVGSTAQRPNSTIVETGMIRYNTDLHRYEGYTQADVWGSLGGVIDQAQTTYISVESDDNSTDVHRIRFFVQGVEVSDFDPTGKLGLGTTTPAVRLDVQDTDAIHIPVGSTAQRPNSAIVETGMIRYNTDLHRYEGYTQADVWGSLGGVIDQAQTTYISVESDDNSTDVHRIRFFVQGVEVSDFDPTGKLGLGTTTPAVRLDIQDTDAIHIPVGSTAQRPSSAIVETGMIRYNTDLHSYEGYRDGNVWIDLDGLRDIEGTTYATVLSDDRSTDTHSIRYFTNGSQVAVMDPSGNLGIGTPNPVCQLHLTSSDAVLLPTGTSAQRPNATSQEGMIRYNADRRNFEGMRLVGTPSMGLDNWVSMTNVTNDTDTTFITVYDPTTGTSLEEIRFYTNAQIVNDTVISGLRFKIDQSGNFGIGGAQNRVLASLLDVMGTENEQFLLSYDSNNYTALTTNTHGFTIQNYAQDAVDFGDIDLVPAGPLRKVAVGNSSDVYDPNNIPIKLAVYGYIYASGGVRYPDGSIQTTSATQSSSGASYGQWELGQVSAGIEKYYQPIDTTQVAIGTDTPLAKLSIAKVNGEAANLPHLELRYTQNDYATMRVDANGSLIVTSGLGQDSDILLQPSGNVGINVNSAVASLHVNHDLFLQGSDDPANTYTGMGMYMRFNTASNHGLIASGNNATSTPYPLTVQASQLSLGGGLSVGSTFASASPPSNGAIVQEQVGIATTSPLASLDVGTTSSNVVIRASQHDQTVLGIVVANDSASAAPADGLTLTTLNTGDASIDTINYTGAKHLQLNPSGGPVSACGTLSDAQLSVSQAGTASSVPVVSMHQASTQAPIFKMTGSSILSNTTTNIVMNDSSVTSARISAYVQVTVLDSAGNLPTVPYFMPLYTLT
ncbi:g1008 [Coccomyxa elongata]